MLELDFSGKREIITTEDGSSSIYVPELNEHYHSTHGAFVEANHIYLNLGFDYFVNQTSIHVIEAGFGTGLNAILTLIRATEQKKTVYYSTYEKYPLSLQESASLNYLSLIPEQFREDFLNLHRAPWEQEVQINPYFRIHKHCMDFRTVDASSIFDVVYYDAFNPDVQPDLWSEQTLGHFVNALKSNGILTTYCVKGIVKQALRNLGMRVERFPGPPGKHQVLRAYKEKVNSSDGFID